MASKTKQVGKGDIRKLMKETKSKINSPLAKYNSAGQLTCILCSTVVKNELVWPAHVGGKLHKDNVVNLKNGKQQSQPTIGKRKYENGTSSSTTLSSSSPAAVSSLPSDFFEGVSASKVPKLEKLKIKPLSERKPVGILKNKKAEPSAPPSFKKPASPSSTNGSSNHSSLSSSCSIPSNLPSAPSSLPADFYDGVDNAATGNRQSTDKDASPSGKTLERSSSVGGKLATQGESQKSSGESGEIPDGFFDDPVEDAKVHHKPYVDPLDAQWELFQKEIKMETHKSEVIEEEEDDVMIYERTLAEIDDQLEGWAKVEALHVKKEAKFIKINQRGRR